MKNGGKNDNCMAICWGLSALAGLGVLIIAMKSMWFIVALVLGIGFALAMGLILQRKLCDVRESPLANTSLGELTGLGKIPHDKLVAADMIETDAPKPAPQAASTAAPETAAATPAAETRSAPAPASAPAEEQTGTKPAGLDAPRGGAADDLKKIKGVGPKLESLLHQLGFYHFDQIAGWTAEEIAWVDENLQGFKGRVTRDDWVAQARRLAAGAETEFSKRVDKGDVY
ncbi:MAG: NADH:ubiquinone oxidoreductase [Paracoccaceae bacterium]